MAATASPRKVSRSPGLSGVGPGPSRESSSHPRQFRHMPGTCIARRTSKWRPEHPSHAHPLGNTKTEEKPRRRARSCRSMSSPRAVAASSSGGAAWNRSLSASPLLDRSAPDRGVSPMPNWIAAFVLAVASFALAGPFLAQAADQGTEPGFHAANPRRDLAQRRRQIRRHRPQAYPPGRHLHAWIRMPRYARMGPGASPGATRVRHVAPQVRPQWMPFFDGV